jgi:hypothetical protein
MHMAVHDGLSRCLPGVYTDIETHNIGIVSAEVVSSVLQESLDGGSLRVVQVEVVRDVAAGSANATRTNAVTALPKRLKTCMPTSKQAKFAP